MTEGYETSVEKDWKREVAAFREHAAGLRDGWDGGDAPAMKKDDVDGAIGLFSKLVDAIKDFDITPRLCPCPDGSVDLFWENAKFGGLCNYGDGRVGCYLHTKTEPREEFETEFGADAAEFETEFDADDADAKSAEVRRWATSQKLPRTWHRVVVTVDCREEMVGGDLSGKEGVQIGSRSWGNPVISVDGVLIRGTQCCWHPSDVDLDPVKADRALGSILESIAESLEKDETLSGKKKDAAAGDAVRWGDV